MRPCTQQMVAHPVSDKQQGLTLLEMTIVITIITLSAAVALPQLSTTDTYPLDTAARELAEAIRFTRAESIRTGIPHGIYISSFTDTAKVYSNPSGTPTYDVYHPVDKKLYTLNFKTDAATTHVYLLSYSIYYTGVFGLRPYIGFSSHGIPKYYEFGSDHMLNGDATITLSYASHTRNVLVSPMTGRVTIQ